MKNTQKTKNRRKFPQHHDHVQTPTVNILFNNETQNSRPRIRNKTLVPMLFNTVLEVPGRTVHDKKASMLERKK